MILIGQGKIGIYHLSGETALAEGLALGAWKMHAVLEGKVKNRL